MDFEKIKEILSREPKLIEIRKAKKVIFVGDTHGDLDASQKVIRDYLKEGNIIVFLGDYVDRGPFSKENLEFLLETKARNPNQTRAQNNFVLGRAHKICAPIYLLQGNHEGHRILKFSPAEFWENLTKEEYTTFSTIVENMVLVFVAKNIIALHGALPDVKDLAEINKIKLGSKEWQQIVWGDFKDEPGYSLGIDPFSGRPQFGRDYFLKVMERFTRQNFAKQNLGGFNKRVLIRSHQPTAPQFMFDDRCLTIFTSSAYPRERVIAILDFDKEVNTAKDLEIRKI